MTNIVKSPLFELTCDKVVFVHQDITIYPDYDLKVVPRLIDYDLKGSSNLVDAVKFLFGKASRLVFDATSDMRPRIVIKDATFMLANAKTVGGAWTIKEVKQ